VVIALIEERLPEAEAAGGAIFDGFPRTVAQAEALDAMLAGRGERIDRVIRLKVDDQALLDRISTRYADEGRADDNPEAFEIRLAAYNASTAPLLPFYGRQGKLVEVDGMAPVEAVAAAISSALEQASARA
jgi:adenylate kinase